MGKEGAEELAFALNQRFGAMLDIAQGYGGDLLKFGGDALLLLFRGDEHERRAAAAASNMRSSLRAAGKHRGANLRMSVGINSGDIDFFMCGSEHRELLVLGPAASRTVTLEEEAGAGRILISGETARQLPASAIGAAHGSGYLLKARPAATALSPAVPDALSNARDFVPVPLVDILGTALTQGEHRTAAVGFIHFTGVDAAMMRLPVEEVAAELETLVSAVQESAAGRGVCVLYVDTDRDGGKFVLTAGVPVSQADAEELLLGTLVGVTKARVGFTVRAGAHRGRVFACDVGSDSRRAYTVMGDAVNVAARVMAHAGPGEVLATSDLVEKLQMSFPLRAVAPFPVKGKRRHVSAYVVEGEGGVAAAPAQGELAPLVGREDELALLSARLHLAQSGVGVTLALVGDSGIGKTRLIREFLRASESPALWGGGHHTAVPYGAVRTLLRDALGHQVNADELRVAVSTRAPDSLSWLPLIAEVMDIEMENTPETAALEAQFRGERTADAVVDLLARLLDGPAVLVFDDSHLLDGSSAEVARRIATASAEHPWLVIFAAHQRGEGVAGTIPGVEIIEVTPLAGDSAESLASTVLGNSGHPLDVAKILERAGGNPFYLIELCTAAAGRRESLPEDVESVVVASLDSLAPEARQFVRTAAVLGMRFPGAALAHVTGTNGEVSAGRPPVPVRSFLEAGESGSIRFRHRLAQEAAYETLPYRVRRRLHGKVASLIDSGEIEVEDRVEMLAFHYSRAGNDEAAWRCAVDAGRRALAKHANSEAAEFFGQAVESGRRLASVDAADLAGVLEAQGDVLEMLARYEDAESAYERARRLCPAKSLEAARLLRKQAILRERRGQYTEALRWLRRSSRMIEDLEHDASVLAERTEVLLATAGVRFRQGRYRDCVESCRQAIAAAQTAGLRPAEAHGYYLIENALTFIGHREAARYRDLALPIYEELGDLLGQANVLNNLGVSAYHEARFEDALAFWERSRHAREQAGDVVGAAIQLNNIAEIHSDQGNLDVAEALFLSARRTFERTRFTAGVAFVVSNLGRLATRAGRFDDAEDLLNTALDAIRELGAAAFEAETEFRLAENAAAQADTELARARLEALDARLGRGTENAPLRESIVRLRNELDATSSR